jgi:hypothetical protein
MKVLVFVLVAVSLFSLPVQGQAPSSAVLPESLLLVFGQAAETRYVPRVRAIHELPANLTAEQANACYEFLNRKLASQPLPDLEFNGLKNELVFALMRQRRRPEELAARLVAMYRDQSHDETWRDYCVQFFGKWYADAPRNAGREAMAAALWEVLRTERANRFAGAAATQLGFLAGKYPEFTRDEVAAACLEALLDPVCSETAKVALLQVCATLGAVGALPEARRLAAVKTNPVLRASAIAAVGFLGDRSDLAWLTPLATSSDTRLRIPARAAISRLQEKP